MADTFEQKYYMCRECKQYAAEEDKIQYSKLINGRGTMEDRNEILMENGEKHTVKGYKALWQPVLLIGLLLLGGCQEKREP